MDIFNFYPMTQLKQPKYIHINLGNIPEEIIEEYHLKAKAVNDWYIFIEGNRGMYGLPQSGLLVNKLLENSLNKHGYHQRKLGTGI